MSDFPTIFKSQKDYFRTQATKDLSFRMEKLKKLKEVLKVNEKRLYQAINLDFGKSEFETYSTELAVVYHEIDYFLKNLKRLGKPRRIRTNLVNLPGSSRIHPEPLGCTLIIGAWNYPYTLTLGPMVAAIAAGNTCMVKPSELPEHTMKLMAEICNQTFPAEYIFVAEGGIPETTELLKLPFDKIFFTGSPKVGRIVYEAAARHLCPVTLELGGKSPAIVSSKSNLEVAAKRIVWGKFLNGGQTCIAPDYVLVHESVKDEFIRLLKKRLENAKYEDGSDHYVKIINHRNFERLVGLIEPGKVVYGGEHHSESRYIQPTILDSVTWNDKLMQEEIFGPLLPVLTYSDLNQAFSTILAYEKPLSAYMFSESREEKDLFTNTISFGGGCINDTLMHFSNDNLPFGGVGNSGMGNYHGEFGFNTFSHQKAVLERATWGEPDLKYPPYSSSSLKWLKRFF